MEKYIPYEKLSKKEKRRLDSQRRTTWGCVNPVTKKPKTARPITAAKPGIGNVSNTNQFRVFYLLLAFKTDIIQPSTPKEEFP